MLRCLFEPYGKWEIFTYIIAGKKVMKVIDVFSLEHVSDSEPSQPPDTVTNMFLSSK